MRRFLLTWLAFAATALAEDAHTSRIIYLPDFDFPSGKSQPFPIPLPELGRPPFWDLRPHLAEHGIKLQPGEAAVWSPASARLFLHISPQNADHIEAHFTGIDDGYTWIDSEFLITELMPEKVTTHPLRLIARGAHGQASSLSSDNSSVSAEIRWEPVYQADGRHFDLDLRFKATGNDFKIDLDQSFALKDGEPQTIWQSPDGRYQLSVLLKAGAKASAPEIQQDAALLKAIESRLKAP
jgi:hypothetical protein